MATSSYKPGSKAHCWTEKGLPNVSPRERLIEAGLKLFYREIEQGAYPGIVKTTLDGVDQIDYLTGKSDMSARDVFYYFSGATPSAVRYKNWKMYYTMSQPRAEGWILPLIPFHWTLVQNIRRDPFEQAVGTSQKSAPTVWGARLPLPRLPTHTTGTCCPSVSSSGSSGSRR